MPTKTNYNVNQMKKLSSLKVTAIFAISALLSACADSNYTMFPDTMPEWWYSQHHSVYTGPGWNAKEINKMIELKNQQIH
ncbi:hypothetical protein [Xenorhabdus sp. KK7.4]|uniref:hypothetical protein n=2 Tax=Xenorhabdus sp. KK7.4 TaxID=1851572 RepID=UPI0030D85DFA